MTKILVVDDEKNLRLLYKTVLEAEGFVVDTAGDANECFRKVEEFGPDLVVLDIFMPGMDGLETMSKLLADNPSMLIILNSPYSSYKDNFLSWAADAYVIKSTDSQELVCTIKRVLKDKENE